MKPILQTGADSLLDQLRTIEVSLHQPEVRADRAKMADLLHPEFWEVGRSGVIWTREATLAEFDGKPQEYRISSRDFALEMLGEGIAMLSYKSAHMTADGQLDRHTQRTSIWVFEGDGWRMRFHQGTPIPSK